MKLNMLQFLSTERETKIVAQENGEPKVVVSVGPVIMGAPDQ